MRLFTGIDLPPKVASAIGAAQDTLKPHAALKWSPVRNLHITTKFIGAWPEERLGELRAALGTIPPRPAIPIKLDGLGWFPNPHQPRILWVRVDAPPSLAGLARETEERLEDLGVGREDRPYRPHLTLARIEDRKVDLAPLRQAIAGLPSADLGEFEAGAFHLYLSQPEPGGSRYTKLAEFPFGAPA